MSTGSNAPTEILVRDTQGQIEVHVPDGHPAVLEVLTYGPMLSTIEIVTLQNAPGPVGPPGPPGPQGPPGAAGVGYKHTQASASALWTVAHNLGHRPAVSVTTTGGVEIEGGEVLHLNDNTLTITFDVPFSGYARLV